MRRFSSAIWRPLLSCPIYQPTCRRILHTFPPHVAFWRQCNICKQSIALKRLHCCRIREFTRSGRNSKESFFRVQRPQASIFSNPHPRDIITYTTDGIPRHRADHHSKVCLACSTWKCGSKIPLVSFRITYSQNQTVLSHPVMIVAHC